MKLALETKDEKLGHVFTSSILKSPNAESREGC